VILLTSTNPAKPVTRELAAAKGRGNENDAPDLRAVLEDERFGKELPAFGRWGTCSGGFLKSFIQSLSPVSVMRSRLMQPPMLWPITTIRFASNRDDRCANAVARGPLLWARGGLVRQYELAIARRHSQLLLLR
jgi:hypothetical protein